MWKPRIADCKSAVFDSGNRVRQGVGWQLAATAERVVTGSFHPPRIRHPGHSACSEPPKPVQFVQPDQHKRLASDFASA